MAGVTQEERLGFGERADFVTVKAMVRNIPHDREVYYPSCGRWGNGGSERGISSITMGVLCLLPECHFVIAGIREDV